ncbi:PTPRG [Mytilus edulis]|uniref:protein-tyrosine-phosphatase n=1 Tax=Mytilus edulis TaxID=6550 RepID=A0A8S3TQS1_MYTED|nr:PTPRG [Mytilus edulis]
MPDIKLINELSKDGRQGRERWASFCEGKDGCHFALWYRCPNRQPDLVTYTWTERAVFLLTAKEDEGNITITYVVDHLKAKYILDANYSLIIKNVDLDDTKQYTCSVGIFRDPETKDLIQKFENVTELYVQAPGAPTILNATTIGTDSVYLRWLRPKKFYRDVEEYLIEFIDLDSYFTKTKKIPEKEYEVVKSNDMTWIESAVSNLPSNRHYSVRIAGLTQSLFNAHQYPGNYSAKEFFYLQVDHSRVYLAKQPQSEKIRQSDYINANYVDEQYMLIHDALVEYLLSHDTEVRNGEINKYIHNLTTIQEDKSSLLQKQFEDDYVLMTKMISCSNWPRDDQPLCKAFDLIDTIRDIHRLNDIGPVIVVDRYGGVTGCKFCALWSSLDQLQHDKTIDIYHLCKLYHKKRAGIIGSVGDYLFLYSAVDSYCNDQNEKDSALMSNHLILRSSKKNGTIPRSPSVQNKVPRSPSLPNNHHSSKAETNSSKAETNV